jgi:hypothetical protein
MRKQVKGTVVALIDLGLQLKMPIQCCCELIAAELQELNFRIGGHRDTPVWKVLKGWRDGLSKLDENGIERKVYDALKLQFPDSAAKTPSQFRDLIAHYLQSVIGPSRSVLE